MIDPYKIELPKRGYKWRIIECDKGASSKGNLMLTVDVELINNPPVMVLNPETGEKEPVDINGLSIRHWVTLLPQTLDRVNQWNSCHGMDRVSLADLENIDPNIYKGKIGQGIVTGQKKPNLDSEKQPIINELTGKPMTVIERRIQDLMCPE